MNRFKALFSFRGRASRLTFWRVGLATTVVLAVLWLVTIFVAMGAGDIAVIPLLMVLPVLAVNLAVYVRRLHDRGKSAWWLLVFWIAPLVLLGLTQWLTDQTGAGGSAAMATVLAALALDLWGLVETGFRRGVPGENRFGQPPPSGLRRRKSKAA
ncbi:MAG: DUF805 domain-containing protein [Caulobacter sp.]|nr:DUF805 domain-containing protein [Caulobacter sp.]